MKPIIIALLLAFGCASARADFSVYCTDKRLARQIADKAAKCRRDQAMEWCGKELPEIDCPIIVTVTGGDGGGATQFSFTERGPTDFSMKISGSPKSLLDDVLPHEVLHTVFASHFRQSLPRWADEGACTTVESEKVQKHRRVFLVECLKTKRGLPFTQLLAAKEYPQDILPLYAQGHSLAEFLIQHSDRRAFVNFIGAALRAPRWSVAVAAHYGYGTLAILQDRWLSWVRHGCPLAPRVANYQGGDCQYIWNGNGWTQRCGPQQQAPLVPVVRQPQQPAAQAPPVKGCTCDQAAVLKAIDELRKRPLPKDGVDGKAGAPGAPCDTKAIEAKFDEINKRLDELCKQPEPTPKPPESPGPTLSHFVLVVQEDDPQRGRLDGWLLKARGVFPKIHVVEKERIPFKVEGPQFIAYDTAGSPMSIAKGMRDTEAALQRVARNEWQ